MKIGNLEVYGVIYKITNKVNGKVYIGQTTHNRGFWGRYSYDLYKNTNNKHLKNSIRKYGIQNFSINEELDVAFSGQELDIKEQLYIHLHKSYIPQFGYNKELGGHKGLPTEETRRKQSLTRKKLWQDKDYRERITKAIGSYEAVERRKISFMKWYNSEENRDMLREKAREAQNRPEVKAKKSGVNNHMSRKVICLNTGDIFITCREASKWAGLRGASKITAVCRGRRNYTGKHPVTGEPLYWAYYDEYLMRQQGA
jgi:group I intron endonuclease